MTEPSLTIRPYVSADYDSVRKILELNGRFSEVIDSAENLTRKIQRDPSSMFVTLEGDRITGTASIMEDGRMAFIVRWAGLTLEGMTEAILRAEGELVSRGYSESSIFVGMHDTATGYYFAEQGYRMDGACYRMSKELPGTLPPQARK